MTKQQSIPEIKGTRAGYIIRFSCPVCATENIIITKSSKDHARQIHVSACTQCRSRLTVRTPVINTLKKYSAVPVLQIRPAMQ